MKRDLRLISLVLKCSANENVYTLEFFWDLYDGCAGVNCSSMTLSIISKSDRYFNCYLKFSTIWRHLVHFSFSFRPIAIIESKLENLHAFRTFFCCKRMFRQLTCQSIARIYTFICVYLPDVRLFLKVYNLHLPSPRKTRCLRMVLVDVWGGGGRGKDLQLLKCRCPWIRDAVFDDKERKAKCRVSSRNENIFLVRLNGYNKSTRLTES